MKLQQAFDIARGDVVSFIGAGGKTSTLIGLGYELAEAGWRVLATTTTQIREEQLSLMPVALPMDVSSEELSAAMTDSRFVFIYGAVRNGFVQGVPPDQIPHWIDAVDSDVMLIEADYAAGRPLKAPLQNEPLIPPETSLVIPVASLSALGQPLDESHVYNVQAVMDRYGFKEGNHIKSPWMAQILRDETLGLRGVPANTRVIAFLNQTPATGYGQARARRVARLSLRTGRLYGVAIGSVRGAEPVHEVRRPIGAVVLAAGMSTRMGKGTPKVLLPWTEKQTIIEHVVQQLMISRIDHIVVVTGHGAQEVKALVEPMGVKVVYNRSYKTGEMLSSLKAGLRAMPDHIAASLVVLGDQPRIQPKVIYKVLMAYARGDGEIVAPRFDKKRGHPVLIGRRYWAELLGLPRNGAPRDLINAHQERIAYVKVNTDSVLRDVDTPDDYEQERFRAGLGRHGNLV
jgi:molybdenum cofactor cytidylyltransferase